MRALIRDYTKLDHLVVDAAAQNLRLVGLALVAAGEGHALVAAKPVLGCWLLVLAACATCYVSYEYVPCCASEIVASAGRRRVPTPEGP